MKTSVIPACFSVLLLAIPAFCSSDTTTITWSGGQLNIIGSGPAEWVINTNTTTPSGTLYINLVPANSSVSCCNFVFRPLGSIGNQGQVAGLFSNFVYNSSTGLLTAAFTGYACSPIANDCSSATKTITYIAGTFTEQLNFSNKTLGNGELTYTILAPEPGTFVFLGTGLLGVFAAARRRIIPST